MNLKKNLLSTNGEIKITGFTFSSSLIFDGKMRRRSKIIRAFNKYSPLELIDSDHYGHSYPTDIWSLGIIAIEMATGKTPFDEINSVEQMKQIINSGILFHLTNEFSSKFNDFLSKCLNVNQDKRLSASELLNHSFIKKADDEEYIKKNLTSQFLPLIQRFKFNNFNEFVEEKNLLKTKKYEFIFDVKEEDLYYTLDDFILQDPIGQGSFGKVYKVKSKKRW